MFKYFLFFIAIFSFLISSEIDHTYNSVITSFTKTSNSGRVNFGITNNSAKYKNIYIDDVSKAFTNSLSKIEGVTYSGYDVNLIFEASGLTNDPIDNDIFNLTDFEFSYNTITFDASYHGYNGMGYYASYEVGQMEFPHSNLTHDSWDPNTTSVTVGIYALWNEIYSTSSPAIVDGSQFTFPTTRIFTGFYLSKYRDLFDKYSNIAYFRFAMDFIISNKLVLSNKLDYELSDDSDVFMSLFASKFIYDLNDKVSVSGSSLFKQDNQGDYLMDFLLEGGYQFNNLSYGYTKLDFKLVPYFRVNIAGKNKIYSNEEVGFKINIFFN